MCDHLIYLYLDFRKIESANGDGESELYFGTRLSLSLRACESDQRAPRDRDIPQDILLRTARIVERIYRGHGVCIQQPDRGHTGPVAKTGRPRAPRPSQRETYVVTTTPPPNGRPALTRNAISTYPYVPNAARSMLVANFPRTKNLYELLVVVDAKFLESLLTPCDPCLILKSLRIKPEFTNCGNRKCLQT